MKTWICVYYNYCQKIWRCFSTTSPHIAYTLAIIHWWNETDKTCSEIERGTLYQLCNLINHWKLVMQCKDDVCLWRLLGVGGHWVHYHSSPRFPGHGISYWLIFARTRTIWCIDAQWLRTKINCDGCSFTSSAMICQPFYPIYRWKEA